MEALAIVEILGRHGEIRHRERVFAFPAIIGRGFDADLILDDPHVAAHHLKLDAADGGGFVMSDLGTHNGFSVPAHPDHTKSGVAIIVAGETVRLGHSQIRIWQPDSQVSPEVWTKNDWNLHLWVSSVLWFIAGIGLIGVLSWISATGPNRVSNAGSWTMLTAVVIWAWSGLWWVASRASNRVEAYLAHLSVAASMVCLIAFGQYATNTLFFAFNLHRYSLGYVSDAVLGACVAYGVFHHLRLVSRSSRAVLGGFAVVVVAAILIPASYILSQSDLDKIGLLDIPSTVRPPWMRVADGVSVEEFLK